MPLEAYKGALKILRFLTVKNPNLFSLNFEKSMLLLCFSLKYHSMLSKSYFIHLLDSFKVRVHQFSQSRASSLNINGEKKIMILFFFFLSFSIHLSFLIRELVVVILCVRFFCWLVGFYLELSTLFLATSHNMQI